MVQNVHIPSHWSSSRVYFHLTPSEFEEVVGRVHCSRQAVHSTSTRYASSKLSSRHCRCAIVVSYINIIVMTGQQRVKSSFRPALWLSAERTLLSFCCVSSDCTFRFVYDWGSAHSTTLFDWYVAQQRLAQFVCAPPRPMRYFLELHAPSDSGYIECNNLLVFFEVHPLLTH